MVLVMGTDCLLRVSRFLLLTCNYVAQLMLEVILSKCKRTTSPMINSLSSTFIAAATLVAIFATQRSGGSLIEVIIYCSNNTGDIVHISTFLHL